MDVEPPVRYVGQVFALEEYAHGVTDCSRFWLDLRATDRCFSPNSKAPGAEAVADEFFGWFDEPITPAQTKELLFGLMEFIANNGPFQGVMGFSEGGIVAAMLLAEDARQAAADFQCGILLSAAPPLDSGAIYQEPASLRCLNPGVDGAVISVPTAHIVGSNEPFARLVALSPLSGLWISSGMEDPEKLHQALFQLCDDERELFVHQLGHEVPGARSVEGLSGALQVMERTIERAQLG
ncbi:hypothetical protein V8C42DRAFT_345151 [Trichoderma barbatum]